MMPTRSNAGGSLAGTFAPVRVSGADANSFLHAQLTCDIQRLAPERAMVGAYLSPKGRVLALLLAVPAGDSTLLLTHPSLVESLVGRLRMFVLRARVIIEPAEDLQVLGEFDAPAAAAGSLDALPVRWHGGRPAIAWPGGCRVVIGNEQREPALDGAWRSRQAQIGMPWVETATSDRHVAQMLNLDRLGAVSFRKGCYPGQEVVARAHYLGAVKRRLHGYWSAVPLKPATGLRDEDDKAVGEVLYSGGVSGSSGFPVLAVVREAAAGSMLRDREREEPLTPMLASGEPNIV